MNQGYGPYRIIKELEKNGLSSELIDETIAAMRENWLAIALKVWQKKFEKEKVHNYQEVQKQKQFLQYRGFPGDVINQLFHDHIDVVRA